MRRLLGRGLAHTAALWPEIQVAYAWVHRAAHILGHEAGRGAPAVRRQLAGLIGAMARHRARAGRLAPALTHFAKVTRSYRPGLFHCYAVADLPRTNNDLEQLFGAHRYHERRATGRKAASPGTVLRGSVRLVAALETRGHPPRCRDLAGVDRGQWRELRAQLEERRHGRVLRTRFRRDPQRYLREIEHLILQQTLPS